MPTPRQIAARAKRLWDAFSLTIDNWELIFEFQGRACAICKKPKKIYHTDHDHDTGMVRGILCSQCNRALGKAQDKRWGWTPECFTNAGIYLLKPPAIDALGHPTLGFPGKMLHRGKRTKRFTEWIKNRSTHTNSQ